MRAPLALLLSALLLGGCAKFPTTDSKNDFTRLHFDFTMASAVNPNYVYLIAIRPIFTGDTTAENDNHGPQPVQTNGGNGFVEGYPTRYVVYAPGEVDRYAIYRFPTVAEAPLNVGGDNVDPDSPVNLLYPSRIQSKYGSILTGTGIDPTVSADGKTLGFDLTTRELTDNDDDARKLQKVQFNILTMNKVATGTVSINDRVFDALGNTRSLTELNLPRVIRVDTGGTYSSSTSTIPENQDDTYPPGSTLPSVDIVSWNANVRLP